MLGCCILNPLTNFPSVIEYTYEADVDTALKTLDGTELNGNRIRLLDNLVGSCLAGKLPNSSATEYLRAVDTVKAAVEAEAAAETDATIEGTMTDAALRRLRVNAATETMIATVPHTAMSVPIAIVRMIATRSVMTVTDAAHRLHPESARVPAARVATVKTVGIKLGEKFKMKDTKWRSSMHSNG